MTGFSITALPSPRYLAEQYPVPPKLKSRIATHRNTAIQILRGKDPRIALLVGPCSIHHIDGAIEYAKKLKELQQEISPTFFLVMRAFLEKPRSYLGWKGFLYDPHLDETHNIQTGLELSRKLLLALAELDVPVASELLDPNAAPYYSDLLTWGIIGARTAASQTHRQLASSLPFPVGFKNTIHGELEPAIYGLSSARIGQTMLGISPDGVISCIKTVGNPNTHLILRGSHLGPNCDSGSIQKALFLLKSHGLDPTIGIDCAHGNSGKILSRQKEIFQETLELRQKGCGSIRMMMLESYLKEGNQPMGIKETLSSAISITDPCLSWQETEEMLMQVTREPLQESPRLL